MRDGNGDRQRRRTVQEHGLATSELDAREGRDRVANDLGVLRRRPEGQSEQYTGWRRLGGDTVGVTQRIFSFVYHSIHHASWGFYE